MRTKYILFIALLVVGLVFPASLNAQEQPNEPVVRAVLFFSPTCPHCHFVMDEVLPPIRAEYGDQLQILEVDASTQSGQQLYQNYLSAYAVPRERSGVPALVVADVVLVGSIEIPDLFPGLISMGLAQGGIDWPAVPGLDSLLATETEQETPVATTTFTGFGLAWAVLIGMFVALLVAGWRLTKVNGQALPEKPSLPQWLVPLVALAGVVVSGYLAFVEVTQTEAVCGPVGDCNAVQSSSYAAVAGIPVAVLGLFFYVGVGLLWLALPRIAASHRKAAAGLLVATTVLGTLFSIYLTALEIFTIRAVCAWCITSAILTTVLMILVVIGLEKERTPEKRRSRGGRATRRERPV